MRYSLPLLLLALPLLAACGRDTATSTNEALRTGNFAEIAEVGAVSTENSDGPGFSDWNGRLDQLLTQDMAAAATGRPAGEAKKRHNVASSLSYSWKSDRRVPYQGTTVPRNDQVALTTLLSGVKRDFFLSRFQTLTESQKAQARQAMDEQLGDGSAAARGTAEGLLDTMSKRHPSEQIEGLGDAAVWEVRPDGQTLSLFVNGHSADLVVDISNDPEVNKAASIALARELIDRL